MKNCTLQFCRARLIAAACLFSVAAALANSSLAAPAVPIPQNYSGALTHGEFVSCGGQILNPPAYSVDGTWVLHLDPMRQAQVPPPAHLTMVVFRDGNNYLLFPNIELTPVSLANGIYTYSYGPSVTVILDTNTNPATFSWNVQFTDNCTFRAYRSLSYVGIAQN